MVEYYGEIFPVQTMAPNNYEYQWVIPKYVNGEPKLKYVVSKSVQLDSGEYFRKHRFLCSCMDWINRRQKFSTSPQDQCKHIRAVIDEYSELFEKDSSKAVVNVFGNITCIKNISEIHYSGYTPIIRFPSNWDGSRKLYIHLLSIPKDSLPISIHDVNGNIFTGGYIQKDTAYIGLSDMAIKSFNENIFFDNLSQYQLSEKESESYSAMQEQYERWAAKKMDVINQSFVFDGEFNDSDKKELDNLVLSNMISGYEILGTSLVLELNNKIIKRRKINVWEGDYKIIIGKFSNFFAVGKNIRADKYISTNIHPHISTAGTPCLSSYGKKIARVLKKREWMMFGGIVNDFLTQYNPKSPYIHL